ncbi:5-(carboxyamino)imidazole ribonucleotide synthase [Fastidiosibacter lacustris]|uniref:5-(carboxyamino)imidazole ribonucleotide synthase n=1 Tax=Fastidiosibacter lacustris TaxID=2056695 RepID=UPI000E341996|nr:5-(carboxyamino)imidazole ribonucleotide synthase [Fastidiosibacter lacustris]
MKIAIVGNGQLAQMLIESVKDLAFKIDAYPLPEINQNGHSNAHEIVMWQNKLKSYDVVTYEIENISVELLKAVAQETQVYPAIGALKVAQDRLAEKKLFTELEIETNNFIEVNSKEDLLLAKDLLGFPFVLKKRRFGYDGKGQFVIKAAADLQQAWDALGQYDLIAESFVNFDFEVSQVASCDQFSNIVFYPLVRNEHREGILRETHVLTDASELSMVAQEVVKRFIRHFNYVGTFAMEFFVKGNTLYANEIAPRVHNSGHWSIDGANISQFRNHMLAITKEEIVQVKVNARHIMMINLIGENVPKCQLPENVYVKSYGKELRAGRKMGHINIVDNELETFIESVNIIYKNVAAKSCLEEF